MKLWIGLMATCLLLVGGGLPSAFVTAPGESVQTLAGNPLKGRNVFVSKGCIKCHAAWGVGGKGGPDLARLGMGRSWLEIAGALWNHSPQMLAVMQQSGVERPTFTVEEMSDFIAYLYYLNYYNEPGDAARGRRLFVDKGCSRCHSIQNSGGQAGPPLDDYRRYRSALVVAQAMWNHGPQMTARMQAIGGNRPELRGREAADLLAYIRGQRPVDIAADKFMLPGSPSAGRRLFAEKGCTTCHAVDGKTRSSGPDLSRRGASASVAEIAGAMWNHGPQIWARMQQAGLSRPTFGGNDMADIVAYLYFLRYNDRPGNAVAGKQLFQARGCAACHANQGKGIDFMSGALSALASPVELMTAMWNHAPAMERRAQDKGMAWPVFRGEEMRDVIEYIKSLAKGPPPRVRRSSRNGPT